MQSDYAWPTLAFGALAALSIALDWIGHRRKRAGTVRIIPWPLIGLLALIVAAYFGAAWIREG